MHTPSPSEVEQATHNLIDAITTVDMLPTDDMGKFYHAFYGDESTDLAGDMFTLVAAHGQPLEANPGTPVATNEERVAMQARLWGKKYSFRAEAETWGEPEEERSSVTLQASTRVVPFVTRQRTQWELTMRPFAEVDRVGVDIDPNVVVGIPTAIGPFPTYFDVQRRDYKNRWFDKASSNHYRMGREAISHVTHTHPMWHGLKMEQPPTPADSIVTLPPKFTDNLHIQHFVDSFRGLNLMLLAATGVPVAVSFVNEQKPEPYAGLRLIKLPEQD